MTADAPAEDTQPERHSYAADAELITDPDERARREARNGLRQFDAVVGMIESFLDPERPFKLRVSHLLHLHRIALDGISSYAGNFRPSEIRIEGSKHQPPPAYLVPEKVEELCDYVNDNWYKSKPIHLASYVLWKLNWVHPFTDGNGRTARAISYVVLCVRLGYKLPGTNTIPDQISRDKKPYYRVLEAADARLDAGEIDLSELEAYLSELLAEQLYVVHRQANEIPQ